MVKLIIYCKYSIVIISSRQKQPPDEFYNFIKKETPTQVFSCEFFEIFKNTGFKGHLWATAFV